MLQTEKQKEVPIIQFEVSKPGCVVLLTMTHVSATKGAEVTTYKLNKLFSEKWKRRRNQNRRL